MGTPDLARTAGRQLHPSLRDPNYLVLRSRAIIFKQWFSAIHDGATVLDIGGRYQPYRPLLGDRLGKYVAVDLLQTPLVNVVADGQRLPFASETFDLVLATQVFEYLPDPRQGTSEVFRVLKPGEVFCLSVAAFAPRFVDEEHWRFTPAGLRSILSGFQKVEVIPELFKYWRPAAGFQFGCSFLCQQKPRNLEFVCWNGLSVSKPAWRGV